MNRTITWCAAVLVLLGTAAWMQAQKSDASEKAVAAMEEQ
jgi:hypothetical protein